VKPAIPVTLPIKTLDWASLTPVVGEANRAIARFDAMLAHMPSPELLRTPLMLKRLRTIALP